MPAGERGGKARGSRQSCGVKLPAGRGREVALKGTGWAGGSGPARGTKAGICVEPGPRHRHEGSRRGVVCVLTPAGPRVPASPQRGGPALFPFPAGQPDRASRQRGQCRSTVPDSAGSEAYGAPASARAEFCPSRSGVLGVLTGRCAVVRLTFKSASHDVFALTSCFPGRRLRLAKPGKVSRGSGYRSPCAGPARRRGTAAARALSRGSGDVGGVPSSFPT